MVRNRHTTRHFLCSECRRAISTESDITSVDGCETDHAISQYDEVDRNYDQPKGHQPDNLL